MLQQQLGAIDSITGVDLESKLTVLVLEKFGVFGKRSDLVVRRKYGIICE